MNKTQLQARVDELEAENAGLKRRLEEFRRGNARLADLVLRALPWLPSAPATDQWVADAKKECAIP